MIASLAEAFYQRGTICCRQSGPSYRHRIGSQAHVLPNNATALAWGSGQSDLSPRDGRGRAHCRPSGSAGRYGSHSAFVCDVLATSSTTCAAMRLLTALSKAAPSECLVYSRHRLPAPIAEACREAETHRLPASLNLTRLACRSPTREQVFRTAPWLSVYVLFIHEGLRPFCESFLRVCQAKIHLSSARIFDNVGVTPKVLCSISVITRLRTQILHVTSHPMFSPRPRYLGQRIVLISGLAQRHLL